MIVDLALSEDDILVTTEVLIIGAGIAGLLLAARLREHQVRVAVLESGGREQKEDTHSLNQVVLIGNKYQGAMRGRFRCLGGTSTRWGGALIPFLADDFAARPYLGLPAWPLGIGDVKPYLPDIEQKFGVPPGSYDEDFVHQIGADKFVPTGDGDFIARFAKWPAFKKRNVATLFRDQIERDADLLVYINATATNFLLDERGRLHSVTARHQNDRTVTIAAEQVVVCAGAIESTRLLLLFDRQYRGKVFEKCNALGRFFYDHISAQMAIVRAKQPRRLNRLAGIRFTGATMRSLRFELSPSAQASERSPSAFGHISFQAEQPTGFDELRKFLRALQQTGRVSPRLAVRIMRDLPYIGHAAIWRYLHKQLYWPFPARYELHVVAEQTPRQDNQIDLARETDIFGLPLAVIRWRIDASDCMAFSTFIRRFGAFWKRRGLGGIGDLEWLTDLDMVTVRDISHGGDIYHPGGTTRMGHEARSAVVDRDLRTFAVPNLWVASTSVFPSGASANPTLMLMLFTARLGDKLARVLRG